MSDHAQEIMEQIISAAGDPLATLETVGNRMGELYDRAADSHDEQGMQLVSHTWLQIQEMHKQTGAAMDLAAAAQKAADDYQKQRDAVVEQHTKLVQDVQRVNVSNPLVDKVWDAAVQSYEEDLMYSDVYMSEDPADDIVHGINSIPVEKDVAQRFFEMLTGGYELQDVHREKLAVFMFQFVRDVLKAEELDLNDPDEAA